MELLNQNFILYPTRGLKCAGCNHGENYYSDGFCCFRSGLYFHETCSRSSLEIGNLYHPHHSLELNVYSENTNVFGECKICRGQLAFMYYSCVQCQFTIDLTCAKKEVLMKIEGREIHEHPLSLVPEMITFTCDLCGLLDDRFPYACNLCDLKFHKDCAESTPELKYSCHPNHPLRRFTRVPNYIDGNCCLCGNKLHIVFYHCSICDFNIDVDCANNPPPFTLLHPKAHDHQLTLMPQRIFICNICGTNDDPNPYVCLQCNFMVHRNCINIPRVIKINRHNHRIHYNHCLDAGNWKCGVCHKKIRWNYGAYSCLECRDFAVHFKCATKFGIWDGAELEGISENTMEVKSYEVIEEGVIEHFSHKNHVLKLKEKSGASDEDMWCKVCTYPVFSSPFYSCMNCNDFILHQNCAHLPKKKIDSFYRMTMTLSSNTEVDVCEACQDVFQGFKYKSEMRSIILDVRCGSISEPFSHESHLHSLYINYSMRDVFCNACGDKATKGLSCEDCRFVLHINCSNLPKMVKHKYDIYHLLSLCYGETTSGEYICEICEEGLNPKKWFYSCDHCGITFHIKCTLGDFIWLKPGVNNSSSEPYVVLNNRLTRPICFCCGSYCRFSSFWMFVDKILCSLECLKRTMRLLIDLNS